MIAGLVLERIFAHPGISRAELARLMQRTPDSLKKPLRRLVDDGLAERIGRGRYSVVNDLPKALHRARVLSGEAKVEEDDKRRHEWQREAYRHHLEQRRAEALRRANGEK